MMKGHMCNAFWVLLLVIPFYASAATYSSIKGACQIVPSSSFSSSNNHEELLLFTPDKIWNRNKNVISNNNNKQPLDLKLQSMMTALTIIPRGGSMYKEEEEESSFILSKLRNFIRSMIEIGEQKSPTLVRMFRSMIGMLETVSGTKLLPEEEEEDTNKKLKKKTKSKQKLRNENESLTPKNQKSSSKKKKKKKVTGAAAVHIAKELKSNNPNYRIQRELKEFLKSPPPNLKVNVGKNNIRIWIITMTGAKNTLYEGEKYRLRVQFPADYPTSPPSVYFLQPTPRHEHVYTNGDICLSLLGKDWRPTMTAQSIAMSILSILSGAQRKSLPMDNARNALNKPGAAQDDWVYHDDNC